MSRRHSDHQSSHFDLLMQRDEGIGAAHALEAAANVLELTQRLLGSEDPSDAVKVAFNMLHPEAPIVKELEVKDIDWASEVTEDRIESAASVLGTLLLANAYHKREHAGIDRQVLGLPSFEGPSPEIPSVDPNNLAKSTPLKKERIIHRKYEALEELADIWRAETGPLAESRLPELKFDLIPKIFDKYGQLGYGIMSGLFKGKKSMNYIVMYLDKMLNPFEGNPLHNYYVNGIAGYNVNAKAGRTALVKHLAETPFEGDQNVLDEEATANLEFINENADLVDAVVERVNSSSRKTPEWASESGETVATKTGENFDQLEAFKIAELKLAVESFDEAEFPLPGVKKRPKKKDSATKKEDSFKQRQSSRGKRQAIVERRIEGPFGHSGYIVLEDDPLLDRYSGTARTRKIKAADELNTHYENYKNENYNDIPGDVLEALDFYFKK